MKESQVVAGMWMYWGGKPKCAALRSGQYDWKRLLIGPSPLVAVIIVWKFDLVLPFVYLGRNKTETGSLKRVLPSKLVFFSWTALCISMLQPFHQHLVQHVLVCSNPCSNIWCSLYQCVVTLATTFCVTCMGVFSVMTCTGVFSVMV